MKSEQHVIETGFTYRGRKILLSGKKYDRFTDLRLIVEQFSKMIEKQHYPFIKRK